MVLADAAGRDATAAVAEDASLFVLLVVEACCMAAESDISNAIACGATAAILVLCGGAEAIDVIQRIDGDSMLLTL